MYSMQAFDLKLFQLHRLSSRPVHLAPSASLSIKRLSPSKRYLLLVNRDQTVHLAV
jgi:hypothetical protein